MCLGAIHWARIGRIYYGFRIEDAAAIAPFDPAAASLIKGPETLRRLAEIRGAPLDLLHSQTSPLGDAA